MSDQFDYYTETPLHFLCFSVAYGFLVTVCYVISGFVVAKTENRRFLQNILLEILACIQMITGGAEGSCVLFHYGLWSWVVYTSLRGTLHACTFRGATADPAMVLLDKRLTIPQKVVTIVVQIAVGFSSVYIMHFFWGMSVSSIHSHKLDQIYNGTVCAFDLKIGFIPAFLLQFTYITSVYYVDYLTPFSIKKLTVPMYAMVLAAPGLQYTGMHWSVLNVIVFSWSCPETSLVGIIIVYALPPMAAKLTADAVGWTTPATVPNTKVDHARNQLKVAGKGHHFDMKSSNDKQTKTTHSRSRENTRGKKENSSNSNSNRGKQRNKGKKSTRRQ
ncbi:uncharacterized protein LOC134855506 [Symsagittifera roscoffensis]|uniref:uncharacterized protein LOC134855506 n=1 Tax=Symsagittifera roscoffensis TaxID=84072 RepID=UPI00307B9857